MSEAAAGAELASADANGAAGQAPRPDMVRRVAVAMMVLGNEVARRLFALLRPDEIEMVLTHAESIEQVDPSEVVEILEALAEEIDRQVLGIAGREHMLHDVAVATFGKDQLAAILGRESAGATAQLAMAAKSDPLAFAQTLGREHPQVISVVMALLEPESATAVLQSFAPGLRAEVIARIANLRSIPAQVVAEIAEIVGREVRPDDQVGPVLVDGTAHAVSMLKKVTPDEETEIFEDLARKDADLAEDLRSRMFIFDDVAKLHAREVQMILREVDGRQLSLALKNATGDLKAFVLSNMSSRAAQIVLDDIEALGPTSVAQVDEAQRDIVDVIMRLAEEGSVNLRPGESV